MAPRKPPGFDDVVKQFPLDGTPNKVWDWFITNQPKVAKKLSKSHDEMVSQKAIGHNIIDLIGFFKRFPNGKGAPAAASTVVRAPTTGGGAKGPTASSKATKPKPQQRSGARAPTFSTMKLAFDKSFKDENGRAVQRLSIDDWDVSKRGYIATSQIDGVRRLFNHLDERIDCLAYLLSMTLEQ